MMGDDGDTGASLTLDAAEGHSGPPPAASTVTERATAATSTTAKTYAETTRTHTPPYVAYGRRQATAKATLRPRSLQLLMEDPAEEVLIDSPTSVRMVILTRLMEAGIDKKEIEGIECGSRNLWFVVFKDKRVRDAKTGLKITIYEKEYELTSTDPARQAKPQYTYVRVYGYPMDNNQELLEQALGVYGTLIGLTDETDNMLKIKTGIKTAKFAKGHETIPSFIYAGRYQVRLTYRGQIKTCRKCTQEGHEARECTAGKVCRTCGEGDHTKGECPKRRCYFCKGNGHEKAQCAVFRKAYPAINVDKPVEKEGENEPRTITVPSENEVGTSGTEWCADHLLTTTEMDTEVTNARKAEAETSGKQDKQVEKTPERKQEQMQTEGEGKDKTRRSDSETGSGDSSEEETENRDATNNHNELKRSASSTVIKKKKKKRKNRQVVVAQGKNRCPFLPK